jgi:hypothetical protein
MWNGFPRVPRIKVNRCYQLVVVVDYGTIMGTSSTSSDSVSNRWGDYSVA